MAEKNNKNMNKGKHRSKIAKLEATIKEQEQNILTMQTSHDLPPIPPTNGSHLFFYDFRGNHQ